MKKYIPLLLVLLAVLAFNFVVCRITIDEQNEKIAAQEEQVATYKRYMELKDSIIERYDSLINEIIKEEYE